MKLVSFLLCMTMLCLCLVVNGQRTDAYREREKAKAFSGLPQEFPARFAALEKLFTLRVGDEVDIAFHENFVLRGTVIDRVQRTAELESINIRPATNASVMYTFSRLTKKEGQVLYSGRALHRNIGDVLLLNRKKDGYYFETKKADTFIAE